MYVCAVRATCKHNIMYMLHVDLKGILLDEAAGIKKSEKPVLPQAVQEGTAEVASWNQKRVCVCMFMCYTGLTGLAVQFFLVHNCYSKLSDVVL